jgi:hypothetical protein
VSQHREQLEKEIQAHNELHNQIQAGQEQLKAMEQERERKIGRIQLLQELAQGEQDQAEAETAIEKG